MNHPTAQPSTATVRRVAFLGLGVMGYPWPAISRKRAST